MPGPFGVEGQDDDEWMMTAWQAFPLLETLAAGTGLEVGLQNDAAACATAERMLGSARGLDHAVCIYLGYGIGAGLILGGELYSGAHGNAGEIGMALFSEGGRLSALEHRASMASLYQHLGLDPAAGSDHALCDLVDGDDPRIGEWVARAATDLRWAVHLVETLFDPQSVILSGGVSEALMRLLMEAITPLLPSLADRKTRTVPRLQLGMTDPWAVALGAAAEPIGRAFEPRFSAILKERA
jgi:predicted NBD/HSP70 family sugar kinase